MIKCFHSGYSKAGPLGVFLAESNYTDIESIFYPKDLKTYKDTPNSHYGAHLLKALAYSQGLAKMANLALPVPEEQDNLLDGNWLAASVDFAGDFLLCVTLCFP